MKIINLMSLGHILRLLGLGGGQKFVKLLTKVVRILYSMSVTREKFGRILPNIA